MTIKIREKKLLVEIYTAFFPNKQLKKKLVLLELEGFHLLTFWYKSALIRSFSGLYSVRMRENTDQKNLEFGHFLRSVIYLFKLYLEAVIKFNPWAVSLSLF